MDLGRKRAKQHQLARIERLLHRESTVVLILALLVSAKEIDGASAAAAK